MKSSQKGINKTKQCIDIDGSSRFIAQFDENSLWHFGWRDFLFFLLFFMLIWFGRFYLVAVVIDATWIWTARECWSIYCILTILNCLPKKKKDKQLNVESMYYRWKCVYGPLKQKHKVTPAAWGIFNDLVTYNSQNIQRKVKNIVKISNFWEEN